MTLETMRSALLAIGLALCGAATHAQSDDPAVDQLRFSGFGKLGLLHADAPEGWGYRRDFSQAGSARALFDAPLGHAQKILSL